MWFHSDSANVRLAVDGQRAACQTRRLYKRSGRSFRV